MGLSTLHTSPFQEKTTDRLGINEYLRLHRGAITNSERGYLSMADGRIIASCGRIEYEPEMATLEVIIGGGLVTAKPSRPAGMSSRPDVGGLRGGVTGFSFASRRRLLRLIASTEKAIRPLFVTLTYPDIFSSDPADWKRDIDKLGKRIARKFGQAGLVYRIEFVKRKSGESVGQIAPHFHLLVWGEAILPFREYIGQAWYAVVGSGDERHLRAGTSVERVKSWNGVMSYVSKYIAKEQVYPGNWYGRVWGVIGRENIPWGVKVVIMLTDHEAIRLVRLGRKYLGLTGKTLIYGLTWFMDCERVLDYLEVIGGHF